MNLADFDYHLPPELVAQYPTPRRENARMLVVHRSEGRFIDSRFRHLPQFLEPGDVLAINNSRVIAARLFGRRQGLRALPVGKRNPARHAHLTTTIEVLLVRALGNGTWEALVRPGRKISVGERLFFESSGKQPERIEAEVVGRGEYGLRTLRFDSEASLERKLRRIGHVPLPPYIQRPDEPRDRLRFQTVYAREPGSVAAPTAGLHITKRVLGELSKRGVEVIEITLHVSLGTFQPVHESEVEQHKLHPERFEIQPHAAARINEAIAMSRRIVAVGTTTVRTLEHAALLSKGGRIEPGAGDTQLFIMPGFDFQVIGGLLTNFHLPRTTLLMLVSAFAGRDLILAAYEHAVRQRYRFYSYGDCMLIL
jgi:S-adenosylmethionine:tRNA ribosyltransferase-isomerase